MEPKSFSPKSFLKARRPERFSDSVIEEATELDRSLLEFHLSSLTSRSQEVDFERFSRLLCEREICPNLLPHTGPTGGGDSKVDSETYPVADDLALAWYVGSGRTASQERWAFAFSAKADWPPKVRSDVAKLVATKREYKKAFFVTNQSVPDRKRAEVEDGLRAEHDIDVRIFDRTWILDRVFMGRHERLAISELEVTGFSRREVKKGPIDVKREKTLEKLEEHIREALQAGRVGTALVEVALDSADVARNLERPRDEVEGRYSRADSLALRFGTPRQQVEAAYQWAWTLYWWFEDYNTFSVKYDLVQERAIGSQNAYDLERLMTLWNCLHGAIRRGELDPQSASYNKRTDTLIAELDRLRGEKDRPSAALQAETLLLEVRLARQLTDGEPVTEVLHSLREVVLRSEGLVGYPLEPLVDTLTEIGQYLEGVTGYDELFETIVSVASRRDGEVSAARLLLKRGEQQFLQGKSFEAIATLGKSLGRLYKHETRYEIVRALYLCGCAYDQIGLPWAARGTLLVAASVATNELWQYGEVTPYQASCYRRLKWIELRLGRLPQTLAWHELDVFVRHELVQRGYDSKTLFADEPAFNILLGRLLLRTDFCDLKMIQSLPDILDRLGLEQAADGLLYALGHKERFEEMAKKVGEDPESFARRWRSLKADQPLPESPLLYYETRTVLQSHVLGCHIAVNCKIDPPCLEVAESMLAALESFLATSALDRAIAQEPELTVDVRTSDFEEDLICVSVEERAGRPHLVVCCQSFDPHRLTIEKQIEARDAVFKVAMTALEQIVVFRDFRHDIETLFRDERVSERAVAFTCSFGAQSNVFGASPRTRITSWTNDGARVYPLCRTGPWELEANGENNEGDDTPTLRFVQEDEPPRELVDPNLRSHEDIETVSLIRQRLWDRAGWSGILYLNDAGNEYPPVFGLVFRDRKVGREIFEHWRREFGQIDTQEKIRLTVVRGIDKAHPHAYRVIVGSALPDFRPDKRFVTCVNRLHRMDATTPDNLDRFIRSQEEIGALYLAPAFAPQGFDGSQTPEVEMDLRIGVRLVHVRNAWEIGLNDIDSVAIDENCDPVIPEGVENPPVLKLIRSRRAR
jgi:tetratricopeptide (TPR) repeat protein